MAIEAPCITHLMKLMKKLFSINISLYTCQFGIRTSRSRDQPAASHLSDTLPPIDCGFYIALRDAKTHIFHVIKPHHSL